METVKPNRFDYVQYDEKAKEDQALFKEMFQAVELAAEERLSSPRAKALVMTNLEQAYMWIGKAIRDDQIARNGSAPLEEERKDS